MTPEDVRRHFEESGALLTGHFRLSSGLHSDRYLQCAKVLQWPRRAEALGAALGEMAVRYRAQAVVSPAMGGLIIGQEVARALDVRAVFAERVDGAFTFRRGFEFEFGERVLVVEDVVTTGKSTGEVLSVVRAAGAEPVACASIVDRRTLLGNEDESELEGLPYRPLLRLAIDAWTAQACPLCREGSPVVSPGSRHLAAPAGA